MKIVSRFGVATLLLLALALFVLPAVRAGEWNHETRVTFNNAVQLPGVVLAPGEYRFELLNSPSNRHIVQVFNIRHDHVYGTWFTIPTERMEPTGKTVFVMEERPYGEPTAIKKWFYPGELIGDEFIYGKEKETAVAAVTSTTETEITPAPEQPALTEERHEEEAAPAATTEATPVEPQEPAVQEPAKQPEQPAEQPKEELPQTASNVYLYLLIGSITVLSGAVIRRFAKS